MQPLQQSETQQAVENQEQRYDEVEESRHDQDQKARNERHDRRDVGDCQKVHFVFKGGSLLKVGEPRRSFNLPPGSYSTIRAMDRADSIHIT